MSGVQGPLETRAKTTVETAVALEGLDATPWDSGELAYVRSTGATYELVREDLTVGPSTFDSIAVSPPGSVGRWIRICFSCSGASGGSGITGPVGPTGPSGSTNFAFTSLTGDTSNSADTAFVSLLSVPITTTTESGLLILADATGEMNLTGQGQAAKFTIQVDGEAIPVIGQSFAFQAAESNTPAGSSIAFVKVPIAPGLHTVTLLWASDAGLGSSPILSILAAGKPDAEGAHLVVEAIL